MTIKNRLECPDFPEGTDGEREVEFEGEFLDGLEEVEYPVTLDDLLIEFGETTVTWADDARPLHELLEPNRNRTFDSREAVERAIATLVHRGSAPLAGHNMDVPLVMCADCQHYREARVVDGQSVPLKKTCPWCGSETYRDGHGQ